MFPKLFWKIHNMADLINSIPERVENLISSYDKSTKLKLGRHEKILKFHSICIK